MGFDLSVKPVRGQILVTERAPRRLNYPTELVRQSGDGTFMIGGSWEEVGFDTGTSLDVVRRIARNGVTAFPFPRNVKLVRSWAALRIIAPDMAPVYDELAPGAYVVTCYSGGLAGRDSCRDRCELDKVGNAHPEYVRLFSTQIFDRRLRGVEPRLTLPR